MHRRQFLSLSAAALSTGVAGCGQRESTAETDTPTPPPEGATPECWPAMCEGTQLIEVDVQSGVSGDAVLETNCRGEPIELEAGESVQLVREADGEGCGVTLFLDGEQVYSEYIEGHVSVTVTVEADGTIDEERVLL